VRPSPATLLLGHHGTDGAVLAASLALSVAEPGQTTLVHCLVVPDLWAGMQGDDWLNNASTRDAFGSYVEGMLEKDAREQLATIEAQCKEREITYRSLLRVGDPAECLLAAATESAAELVVIGPPRPKGVSGLRSRMDLEKLVRGLHCPLLIAQRP
jgi:nucleotide-binding universal stress UspA family protein